MTKTRLNLEISEDVRNQMEDLVARTGSPSITETIRRAMAIYDLITEHQEEGGKLIFQHKDGEQETLRII